VTVRELIEALSKHRPDAKVLVTWETTFHTIDEDQIYVSADRDVVIDADANAYKEQIMAQKGWTRRAYEEVP
jgi:hypothetical protein